MLKIKPLIALLLLLLGLSGCSAFSGSPAMSVSVSSDGRYVISAHRGTKLYLWDIETQTKKLIARDANIYSAYFVRVRDVFIWQDLENQVHVHSVQDGELFTFKYPEPVYGHLMTRDLRRYIVSDIGWGIHITDLEKNSTHTLKNTDGKSFLGFGKVLNLSLSADEHLLLMAGSSAGLPKSLRHRVRSLKQEAELNNYGWMNGVALWSLETLEPLARLDGNSSKTHASISPDGQWVVSGDENGLGYYWNTRRLEQDFMVSSYYHFLYVGQDEEGNTKPYDISGLIPYPKLQVNDNTLATVNAKTVATGFISNSEYYVYIAHAGGGYGYRFNPYAVLFETGSPWPVKYFDLGTNPMPSVRDYSRNLTVATAPEAGILVTGQHSRGGINVYQFDAENLTLKRIWVGR